MLTLGKMRYRSVLRFVDLEQKWNVHPLVKIEKVSADLT